MARKRVTSLVCSSSAAAPSPLNARPRTHLERQADVSAGTSRFTLEPLGESIDLQVEIACCAGALDRGKQLPYCIFEKRVAQRTWTMNHAEIRAYGRYRKPGFGKSVHQPQSDVHVRLSPPQSLD